MDKLKFRPSSSKGNHKTDYPTLDNFENNRRSFLTSLGSTLLGAGALSIISGCNTRLTPHGTKGAGADGSLLNKNQNQNTGSDGTVEPAPDLEALAGEPMPPDSRIDQKPDMEIAGGKSAPDLKPQNEPDMGIAGGMTAPKPDMGFSGDVDYSDARIDSSNSCPDPSDPVLPGK